MGLTGFNRARRAAQDAAEAAAENDTDEQNTDLEAAGKALAENNAIDKTDNPPVRGLKDDDLAAPALVENTEKTTDLPDMGTDAQPLSANEQVDPVKEQPAKTSKSKKSKADA